MWCLFFTWQKFALGQEGHWRCLKEVSELCQLADSSLIGMTHVLIRFGGKQKKPVTSKRQCSPGPVEGRKAYLALILHNLE